MNLFKDYYLSPIGILEIISDNFFILSIQKIKSKKISNPNILTKRTKKQLDEYFKNKRIHFELPVKLIGTEFQKRVLKSLKKIPYGKTKSYKDIAVDIKSPKAFRAVGSANGRNPLLIVVPCHRVIANDGTLGGFALGLKAKKILLNLEKTI